MFKLLFRPDETVGAVAGPAAVDPPDDSPPSPPKTEDESVPAGEQEPGQEPAAVEGEGKTPESGTPPPDEDVPLDDQIAELMVEAAKVSPASVEKLIDSLPEEEQAKYRTSDTERAAIAAEQSQTTRTATLNAAYQAYQPYSQPLDVAEWKGWAEEEVKKASGKVAGVVKDWKGDGTDNLNVMSDDFPGRMAAAAQYTNTALQTQQSYLSSVYQNGLMTALTAHPSYSLLSKETREETDVVKLLMAQLNAAGLADPKGTKKALKAEVEAELGADKQKVELLERLQKITGGNGRKATQQAAAPDKQDDAAILANPTSDIRLVEEIRARQRKE